MEDGMKKNMGAIDRGLRLVAALIIGGLILTGSLTGTPAVALGILAVIFVLTSLIGFCPLYVPLGLSTRKKGGNS